MYGSYGWLPGNIVTVHVWMAPQKHLPAADDADDADAALRLRGKQQ